MVGAAKRDRSCGESGMVRSTCHIGGEVRGTCDWVRCPGLQWWIFCRASLIAVENWNDEDTGITLLRYQRTGVLGAQT